MPQLSEIISQLSQNCLYLKALKQGKLLYSINYEDLKIMSPYNVFQLLKKLNIRRDSNLEQPQDEYQTSQSSIEESWHPSEFKLFSWVSVCYAFTINKEIHDFVQLHLHRKPIISTLFGIFSGKKSPSSQNITYSVYSGSPKSRKKSGRKRKKSSSSS